VTGVVVAAGLLALIAGSLVPVASIAQAQDAAPAAAGGDDEGSRLRPFADVSKGYERIPGAKDGSLYALWSRKRDGSLLAELPRGWESQRHFVALTLASGDTYAGLQSGDLYVYWRRVDNRMVLLTPEVETRATEEREIQSSVKRLFTDRVLLDVPIVSMGPSGQPVIELKDLLAGRTREFFGVSANARLATLKSAKAFPENIEISYEMPGDEGRLQEFHYSISRIPDNTGYKPREADERIGYFTTVYRDLSQFTEDEKWVRYINRWHLEKRDPKLRVSPAKEPIVFYIESTVPVRYRQHVREGVLAWNRAFEKVGIRDAIEVRQQDESTGAYMDLDPEDVRYNFVRWLANDIGTAIGPSRVHPLTGQILDADIILTDGWIRHFWIQFNEVMPEIAMEGFSPETLAWLDTRPQWDPRIRLADPAKRDFLIAQRARRGVVAYGGHALAMRDPALPHNARGQRMLTGREGDGLIGRVSQVNSGCMAAMGKAFDMSMMRLALDMFEQEELLAMAPPGAILPDDEPADEGAPAADSPDKPNDEKKDEPKKPAKPKFDSLDGIPEWFVGPLLKDLTAHEVGHTLGLRHNFRASSIYEFEQINSPEIKGTKPFTGSVMDYNPINMSIKDGVPQGDFGMIDIGPYDYWAIEFGYTTGNPADVLKRVAEPELTYGTDEDVGLGDPLARRYDFAKDPLDYAKSQMELARWHRGRLLDKFVKDGQSWARARRGYTITLGMQTRSLSIMSNWVGGAFVNRARKGDPNARPPIEVVPAQQQRDALQFVIDNAFYDDAFGLTPDLLQRMTVDRWLDAGGFREGMEEAPWSIHDRIGGIQSSALTMLINPTTLRRVYDNEFRVPTGEDALTLPEVMDAVSNAIWSEIEKAPSGNFTNRNPMISSLRRNLQSEHIDRLIDLRMPAMIRGEAGKAVATLATRQLRTLSEKLKGLTEGSRFASLDTYTQAHLTEAKIRIDKALDADYILNPSAGGGAMPFLMFGQPADAAPAPVNSNPEPLVDHWTTPTNVGGVGTKPPHEIGAPEQP
jgi:hypothetical protein